MRTLTEPPTNAPADREPRRIVTGARVVSLIAAVPIAYMLWFGTLISTSEFNALVAAAMVPSLAAAVLALWAAIPSRSSSAHFGAAFAALVLPGLTVAINPGFLFGFLLLGGGWG